MKQIFYLFILVIIFSGCANVKIYSDKELQKEAAIKFHYATPYLLVEYNLSSETKIKSTIVYLPDLSETYYVKAKQGIGSANMSIAFANGSISSFGLITDSKVPETLTSMAGLITAIAAAKDSKASFELYRMKYVGTSIQLEKVEFKN